MRPPQVKFDSALVGEPEQARLRVDEGQGHRVADRLGLVLHPPQPLGGILWAVAQVVRGSSHPLRVHAQRHRAVFEMGEHKRGDLPVIAQQLTLGESRLRPVHFLQVRDLDGLVSQLPSFR